MIVFAGCLSLSMAALAQDQEQPTTQSTDEARPRPSTPVEPASTQAGQDFTQNLGLASMSQTEPASQPTAQPASALPIAAAGDEGWEQGRSVSAQFTDVRTLQAGHSREDGWRLIPRALLYLPRMVLRYALLKPIDAMMKLYRWQDTAGFRLAVNSAIRSDFRARFGLGYSTGSLLGEGNRITAGFSYGGKDFQSHDLSFKRKLDERNTLTGEALYSRDGDEQFHGIGMVQKNRSRFRLEEIRAGLGLRTEWSETFSTEIGAGWNRFTAEDPQDLSSGEVALSDRFDPDTVTGFGPTTDFVVASLKSRVDLRGPTVGDAWELMIDSHADAYWDVDGSDFSTLRYGGQLNVGVPLPMGHPMLTARFLFEGAEEHGVSSVPFYLLPNLGMDDALRGYSSGRLRVRLMTVAGLEYRWPLSLYTEALLFVDSGRVYPSYDALTFKDWKWGTGAGFRVKNKQGEGLFSVQAAYSTETIELVLLTGVDLF
jgi:hypothetical protein